MSIEIPNLNATQLEYLEFFEQMYLRRLLKKKIGSHDLSFDNGGDTGSLHTGFLGGGNVIGSR